ncbi:MAG: hypothetical protein P4L33_03690, partial [Capsulimonadaceae bacterium]|nr:hypothetical protein [Capsulimonadaceae bacterium]
DLSTPSEWGPLLSETERLLAALPSAPKLLPLRLLGLARSPEPVEGEDGACRPRREGGFRAKRAEAKPMLVQYSLSPVAMEGMDLLNAACKPTHGF